MDYRQHKHVDEYTAQYPNVVDNEAHASQRRSTRKKLDAYLERKRLQQELNDDFGLMEGEDTFDWSDESPEC